MWWEYAIVIAVVGGAAAALIVRFRRTVSGRAGCGCGCQDTCAALGSVEQELAPSPRGEHDTTSPVPASDGES